MDLHKPTRSCDPQTISQITGAFSDAAQHHWHGHTFEISKSADRVTSPPQLMARAPVDPLRDMFDASYSLSGTGMRILRPNLFVNILLVSLLRSQDHTETA